MKKQRTLLVLLGVVLGLFLLLTLVTILSTPDTDENSQETTPTTYLYIVERDPADIRAIDYIYKGAEAIRLVKSEQWFMMGCESFPVNQTRVKTLANALGTVAVHREVAASAEDYAQYGLVEPSSQVTLTYADGSELTFMLGNSNPYLKDTCYLRTSDSDAVYLVSETILTFFAYAKHEMLELDSLPSIETSALNGVTVTNPRGSGIELTRIEDESDPEKVFRALYGDGREAILNSAVLAGDLLGAVKSFSLIDPLDYGELDEAMSQRYGFEEATEVTLHYTETIKTEVSDSSSSATKEVKKTFKLKIGAVIENADGGEETFAYLRIDGSNYVYRVSLKNAGLLVSDFAPES